jgi:hypothetical protein
MSRSGRLQLDFTEVDLLEFFSRHLHSVCGFVALGSKPDPLYLVTLERRT